MQKLLDLKKAKLMRLYAGTTQNTEVGELQKGSCQGKSKATGFCVVGIKTDYDI